MLTHLSSLPDPSAAGRSQLRRGQGHRPLQHCTEPGAEGESWAGLGRRGFGSPPSLPAASGSGAALPFPPLSWCLPQAQLGDSRLNPDVGYLLLHTLCPALYALVEDGLKPFQKDLITGQRKNSPWSVVEASVKTGEDEAGGISRSLELCCSPGWGMCTRGSDCALHPTGPNTRSLHSLCWHVAGLAPLSSTRQKFHAFILGLLK